MKEEILEKLKEEARIYGWKADNSIKHSESFIAGATRALELIGEEWIKMSDFDNLGLKYAEALGKIEALQSKPNPSPDPSQAQPVTEEEIKRELKDEDQAYRTAFRDGIAFIQKRLSESKQAPVTRKGEENDLGEEKTFCRKGKSISN